MSRGEDDKAPRPQSVAQLLSKRGRPPTDSPRTTASNRERFSNLFSSLAITSVPTTQDGGSPSLLRRMLAYATPQTLPARATTSTAENWIGEPEAGPSAQATPSHLSRLPDELPAVRSNGPDVPADPALAHTVEDAHHGSVLCLALDEHDPFRDDKGLLVTGSSDSTAVVWEVDWGVPLHVTKLATLSGHSAAVLSVVLTPTHIITSSRDHNLRIFSRVTFELQHTIVLHTAAVNCLTTCVDHPEQVVSASSDGTWAIIDVPSTSVIFRSGGPGSGLACVACAGEFIVTGDNNRSVKLWTSSGEHLKTFVGHTDLVRSVAIDLDTRVVVSASYDRTVRIWDLDTGEAIRRMSVESMVFDLQVSPGSLVCGSEDGKVRIWTYGFGLPYRDLLD